jgi:hypothetical protein
LAVVAADFIRNNRDEAKKGFYGRLKQGLYPLGAPLGYLDGGKGGKVKEIDPVKGPLVRRALELYATGRYSFRELRQATEDMGLWNKHGKPLTLTALTKVLNNPFYAGTIRLLKTEETFQGIHEPLIPKDLFLRVQQVLRKKTVVRKSKHDYLYRRLFQCASCGLSLIASIAKGHIYYRCQTQRCPTNSVREERLTEAIQQALDSIPFEKAAASVSGRSDPEAAGNRCRRAASADRITQSSHPVRRCPVHTPHRRLRDARCPQRRIRRVPGTDHREPRTREGIAPRGRGKRFGAQRSSCACSSGDPCFTRSGLFAGIAKSESANSSCSSRNGAS